MTVTYMYHVHVHFIVYSYSFKQIINKLAINDHLMSHCNHGRIYVHAVCVHVHVHVRESNSIQNEINRWTFLMLYMSLVTDFELQTVDLWIYIALIHTHKHASTPTTVWLSVYMYMYMCKNKCMLITHSIEYDTGIDG